MSVTKVQGFQAYGLSAGIKKNGKVDMALIYSPLKCVSAAVYTTNKVQAAPLQITKQNLEDNCLQAVIINSGNANACTGQQGYTHAKEMCRITAKELGISERLVAVSSTGVIGVEMPITKVANAIPELVKKLSAEGGAEAAEAIMTTDTFVKQIYLEKEVSGKKVAIGGIAKGSGMIHPNMATMLAFLTTDVNISAELLQQAIKKATEVSFNMVSVDGDTSTNDMALIMANGMAENALIAQEGTEYDIFLDLLMQACIELAKMMAKDGEGASKLLEVKVTNATSFKDAKLAALAVIKSSLVKSALFGEDANWGRILAAVGYSGCNFIPEKTNIWLASAAGKIQTANNGAGLNFDEAQALKILQEKEVTFIIDLQNGAAEATAWGCDLTYDYVKINADYRT